MSKDIRPIETYYNGYRFRSRLEARWAVFFDHVGIEYEYEPEGFVMHDNTPYLPDFFLPRHNTYVEIKPANAFSISFPDDGTIEVESGITGEKVNKLCHAITGLSKEHTFILFQGDPYDVFNQDKTVKGSSYLFCNGECVAHVMADMGMNVHCETGEDCNECDHYNNFYCFNCVGLTQNKIIICGDKYISFPAQLDYFLVCFLNNDKSKIKCLTGETHEQIASYMETVIDACDVARQARFEHGECG